MSKNIKCLSLVIFSATSYTILFFPFSVGHCQSHLTPLWHTFAVLSDFLCTIFLFISSLRSASSKQWPQHVAPTHFGRFVYFFGPSQIIPDQANTSTHVFAAVLFFLFYGEGIYTNHAILVTLLLASASGQSSLAR